MARLWDASRMPPKGYSLEGLSADLLSREKVSMKTLFGAPKVLSFPSPLFSCSVRLDLCSHFFYKKKD